MKRFIFITILLLGGTVCFSQVKVTQVLCENRVNPIGTYNEPVRKHETFKPIKILTTPKGEKVIDFGQNLVGWVTAKLKWNAGDKITISHAEVLDKEGNFRTLAAVLPMLPQAWTPTMAKFPIRGKLKMEMY